jgi:subtilisin-like proprotein convertase family protein
VKFTPGAAGTRTAAIHIASNDVNENPFDITLTGTGFSAGAAQEIVVEQPAGTNISDGGSRDFGSVLLGSNTSRQFTILNIGGANLTGLAITRYGAHAADFTAGVLSNTTLAPGTSATFTLTFAPAAGGTRSAAIRIASNDADENPFDISLNGQGEVINTNVTTIPSSGNASPYPSSLSVSGITGTVTALRVKLNGLTHTWPDDMDVFLVSPAGQVCVLMSDAGGSNAVTNCNLVFEDAAAVAIPDDSAITSGNYRPTDYETGESLPPGGSGSIGTNLLALAGGNVNGDWKLFVSDDTSGDSGSIASWSLLFTTIAPEIAVEQPAGTNLSDGSASIALGSVNVGSSSSVFTFTIRNIGTANLTGLAITKNGSNSSDFTVGNPGITTLAPGNSTTFAVTFIPAATGSRSAAIHIASNDADENPFDINLTGTGVATAIQTWRQTHFGSVGNTGDGADLNDFDKDGLANILEFAFGLNPKQNSAGLLPQPQKTSNNFVISFIQPAGVSGVAYGAEWSQTLLPGSWTAVADTGTLPQHIFSVSIGTKTKLYMRLKVTGQ